MKLTLKGTLKVTLPLLVGALILWFLYRNIDVDRLLHTLRADSKWWVIVVASLFGTIGNTFRGLRWDIMLRQLDPPVKTLTNSILTTQGTYAVNMVLPRLGEIWRCGTMKLYTGLSFSKLFGTVVMDRALDILVGVVLAISAALLNYPFFYTFFRDNPDFIERVETFSGSTTFWILLAVFLVVLVVGIVLLRRFGFWEKFMHSLRDIWSGVQTVFTLNRRWSFLLYTVLIWVSYFLQFYLTFYAFSFMAGLGWEVALMAFVLITFSMVAPVQAGLGAWHFMVIYTLVFFGIGRDDAGSFALIVHTFQTLWTTLVGLLCIAALSVYNKKGSLNR